MLQEYHKFQTDTVSGFAFMALEYCLASALFVRRGETPLHFDTFIVKRRRYYSKVY